MMTDSHRAALHLTGLRLVVEKLRLIGYGGFWVVVVTGMILTKLFGGIDMNKTLLFETFGYNNICVYFDFYPSTRVLPFLWAITLVLLLTYIVAQWLQVRAQVGDTVSIRLYRLLSAFTLFEALTLISFSTIFAVSPLESLWVHTVPFFLLQIGMVSLAVSNTVYGIRSGYWNRLRLPSWFSTGAKVYCVVFLLVVAFKIPVAMNAMAGQRFWEQTETLVQIAGFMDVMFLICAAVVPMLKAAYLLFLRRDDLDVVLLTPGIVAAAP